MGKQKGLYGAYIDKSVIGRWTISDSWFDYVNESLLKSINRKKHKKENKDE